MREQDRPPAVDRFDGAPWRWGGRADTNVALSEFFAGNHTVAARFMLQLVNMYTGPMVAVHGSGEYFIGNGDPSCAALARWHRPLRLLVASLIGWLQRDQHEVIEYLREENCVLKAQLRNQRVRLTDDERRCLA